MKIGENRFDVAYKSANKHLNRAQIERLAVPTDRFANQPLDHDSTETAARSADWTVSTPDLSSLRNNVPINPAKRNRQR